MLDFGWDGDTLPKFINAATYDQELLEDTSETISDEYPSKFRNFNVERAPIDVVTLDQYSS